MQRSNFRYAADELIAPYSGETDIFIYPGYEWRCVPVPARDWLDLARHALFPYRDIHA